MEPVAHRFGRRSSHAARLALSMLVSGAAASGQVGTVKSEQEITEGVGGFPFELDNHDLFGISSAGLGDLDGDGVVDLAVGAELDDDGGNDQGAVWILFLHPDGTVKSVQKISETSGGFGGTLQLRDFFGAAVENLGDLDQDGVVDIAVGARSADENGNDEIGTVWILFLNADGTVKAEQKISETAGGLGNVLDEGDLFGSDIARLGDLDGDGVTDVAVGSYGDDDGADFQGALWILFLNVDGTVKAKQKISGTSGGFGGDLDERDVFGWELAGLGDLDGDGNADLAASARYDDDGGTDAGAIWILFLNANGTVKAEQKISATSGGFGGDLEAGDIFASSLASPGDLDGDGLAEVVSGVPGDDDGADRTSSVWILFLNADGTVKAEQEISMTSGGFGGSLEELDVFGGGVGTLGDLDGDGVTDITVGSTGTDGDDESEGAVWVLFLNGPPTCLTLDFETEDDLVTPLVNGQHIDTEFGALATLTSTGPNAGLSIFDSSIGGPNDPSQDPDLLVGTGKLLILQTENLPPDANDVFPLPNDDEDGGTIVFDFLVPVHLESVTLVDVDAGDRTSALVLTDGAGRERTYLVPRDWTGDRTLAQPGQGTLDLATLADQVGFASTVTASEAPGFDDHDVVQLEVHWNGSGGLDDLRLCSASLARAAATLRNGSGANPSILQPISLPVLGTTWEAELDCPYGSGLAVLEGRRLPIAGSRSPFGELLIGGGLVRRTARPFADAVSRHSWSIPLDLSLVGLEIHVQGLCHASFPTSSSAKLLRARARYSNAVDLILGF